MRTSASCSSARPECAGPCYATAAVAVAFAILTMSGLQAHFSARCRLHSLLAVGLSLLVAMSATLARCARW